MLIRLPKPALALSLLSLALNVLYALTSPHYEVSDELYHYPMVQYLATQGFQLPPQDPANPGPWRQEGSQPPLYYLMAAALTLPIPQADLALVRRESPLAVVGEEIPDTAPNMMLHTGSVPTDGAWLATRVARLFSAVLGALTVLVTYATAAALFPGRPEWAWGAAGFHATLPMYAFISGSVNNDALSNLLGNLIVLLLIRLLLRQSAPRWPDYAVLGLAVGGGILSKLSIGFTIPVVAVVLLLLSVRFRDVRIVLVGGLISGGLTMAIAGWWYWHNWVTYGDPSGLNRFLQMVGERPAPLDWAGILSEADGFNQAFWGMFGGVNLPMPDLFYQVTGAVTLAAVAGALGWWGVQLGRRPMRQARPARWWMAAGLSSGWVLVTLLACARWTSITPASQGRLAFVALSSIALWVCVGLTAFLPARARRVVLMGGVGALGLTSALIPFTVIAPAYALPPTIPLASSITTWREAGGSGQLSLIGLSAMPDDLRSGQYALFSTDWAVDAPLSGDYALFVHVLTPDGVIVAQRDVYPGGGLMATSDLPAGRTWHNPLAVALPDGLHTGQSLSIALGWFSPQTGQRLVLPDGAETLMLGQFDVPAVVSAAGIPNPIDVPYAFGARLIGYQVSQLGVAQGESFEVTLMWQVDRPIERDYTLTLQMIDPINANKAAAIDQWQPTSTWTVGQTVVQTYTLTVGADAPPVPYELRAAWYLQTEDGSFALQPVLPAYGVHHTLTPMRVLYPILCTGRGGRGQGGQRGLRGQHHGWAGGIGGQQDVSAFLIG